MNELRCLYFPYSRPTSLETVKKAILLFDEIAFVDSQPAFLREASLRGNTEKFGLTAEEAEALNSAFMFLNREGAVRIIDSSRVLSTYSDLITASVAADVNDARFTYAGLSNSTAVWSIASERLPNGFTKYFYPGAGSFAESISLQGLVHAKGDIEKVHEDFRRFAKFRFDGMNQESAWEVFCLKYRLVIGGNPVVQLPAYEIPYLHASSLRINEALLLSEALGYIPFTDSVHHNRMPGIKIMAGRMSIQERRSLLNLTFNEAARRVSEIKLSTMALDSLVPSEALEQRSLEDILSYRNRNQRSLSMLRRRLAEFALEFSNIDEIEEIDARIATVTRTKILSEIEVARDAVRSSWEDFFGKISIRLAFPAISTVACTSFAGQGLGEIVLKTAMVGSAIIGAKGIDDLCKLEFRVSAGFLAQT